MQNALAISSRPPWFLHSRSFASANHYSLAGTSCRQAGLFTAPPLQIRATRWSTNHFRPENANEQNRSCPKELIRTLLIDNYDSYTYNIYQELAVVNGVPPIVIHNDEWTWEHAHYYLYKENAFDNIVLSPGPGSPTCPTDIGICLQILIRCKDIPILGVCLGHQALGFAYGAQIVQAPEPVHGRLSEIEHIGCNLFSGIPSGQRSGFKVMRYHSLMIASELIPEELVPTAWSTSMRTHTYFETQEYGAGSSDADISTDPERSKVLMGLMHRTRPHYGVQVTSACQPPNGFQTKNLLLNKDALTKNLCLCVSPTLTSRNVDAKHLKLKWKKIDFLESQVGGSKNIFCKLFGTENAENTFWLDSSYTDQGRSRYSFMGGKGGSLWKQLTYHLSQRSEMTGKTGGHLSYQDVNGFVKTKYLENGLFDFLDKELKSFHYDKEDFEGLPFDFCGGFIGFIGYDLKVECGASANRFKSAAPDACLFFADNIVAVDHSTGDVYILQVQQTAIDSQSCCKEEDTCWLSETERKLLSLKSSKMMAPAEMKQPQQKMASEIPAPFVVDKSKDEYMEDVERCLGLIRDGESYELCLTTQMRMSVGSNLNALDVYINLREANPAPYAAWLNFSRENLCICCSSPERFLRLDRVGLLEAKPMKGTIARGSTAEEDHRRKLQLQHSEKEQAENLMIVDVVRNDLGRVCESGSVCGAEGLMAVESYATVHTMVSTVRGTKRRERSAVDCIKAAFPGASMTGAPKLRSMRILDSLEASSRGVYSGSIGFLSYNQTFDLNIVIRTVVLHRGQASIGAGGAVVALSNPDQEYQEMLLKVRAPAAALLHQPSSSPLS